MNIAEPPHECVSVITHMQIKPDSISDFISAMNTVIPESAGEDGTWRIMFMQSNDNPCAFSIVDVFENSAAFDAHMQTDHLAKLVSVLADLLAEPPQSIFYTTLKAYTRAGVAL